MVGTSDLTALFISTNESMKYGPNALPLPQGENELAVYLVSPDDEWKEIARFPLRMLDKPLNATDTQPPTQAGTPTVEQPMTIQREEKRRFSLDKLDISPTLNLGLKSQFAEIHSPESNRPDRPKFTDGTVQGTLNTEIARGQFKMQNQFEIIGSSFRNEALRFAERGERAPKVGLSNYLMQFQYGQNNFTTGHTTFGAHRHLVNDLNSRGLKLTFPIGARTDFTLGAMNGSSIVGWDNFFGLNNRRHQVLGGVFGFEVFPERRGGMRIEAGILDGWLQLRAGFNQGNITDAEHSQGLSARLIASDPAQRLRVDAGFTRSRFTNPVDPLLDQALSVVAVRASTRSARYLDASYDLLKEFAFTAKKKATLTLNFRHEKVDPLFRSVGATTQADRFQNQVEVTGSLSEVAINYSHTRFNDNLAEIPSILKTLTRRHSFAVNAPLATLLRKDSSTPSQFWPRVGYTYDRVHQFAPSVPIDGGFEDPSTIPDQLSLVNTFIAEWQLWKGRLTYQLNHSFQDNRQVGREQTDLRNLTHEFEFGWSPLATFEPGCRRSR